jgi:hypothetical protein
MPYAINTKLSFTFEKGKNIKGGFREQGAGEGSLQLPVDSLRGLKTVNRKL